MLNDIVKNGLHKEGIMKLLKKIKYFNKVVKAVEDVQDWFDKTHLDDNIKSNIATIQKCINNILDSAPRLKEPYLIILEAFKKTKKNEK